MAGYGIARTIEIECTPEVAYDAVVDYQMWTIWSPWLIADPQATVMAYPNSSVVGAKYAWDGPVVGAGEMEHKLLIPGKRIEDELRFFRPFKSVSLTNFSFVPSPVGTKVTWDMTGKLPWFLFWMVPTIKTLIAMDYQRGLTMLRDLIETKRIPSKCIVHGQKDVGPIRMAGVCGHCSVFDVSPAMERTFANAKAEFERLEIPTDGDMISVYTKFRASTGQFDYICGWTIPPSQRVPNSALKVWSLAANQAFQVDHLGSHRHLGNAWSVANQLVRKQKLKQTRGGTFEIYRTTPPETPENELLTEIYLPLRS